MIDCKYKTRLEMTDSGKHSAYQDAELITAVQIFCYRIYLVQIDTVTNTHAHYDTTLITIVPILCHCSCLEWTKTIYCLKYVFQSGVLKTS